MESFIALSKAFQAALTMQGAFEFEAAQNPPADVWSLVRRGSDAVRADRPYYRQGKGSRSTSVSSVKFRFRGLDLIELLIFGIWKTTYVSTDFKVQKTCLSNSPIIAIRRVESVWNCYQVIIIDICQIEIIWYQWYVCFQLRNLPTTRFEAQTLSIAFVLSARIVPTIHRAQTPLKRKRERRHQNLVGRSCPNPTEAASTKRSGTTRRLMFNPCVEGFFTATKGSWRLADWQQDWCQSITDVQSILVGGFKYFLFVHNKWMGLSFPLTFICFICWLLLTITNH